MTTANGILRYLYENSPWLDPQTTVDTVKCGDADRPILRAGVCWYPSLNTLEAAHAAGCDTLVVHEPVYWDGRAKETAWEGAAPRVKKEAFLNETGMTIVRAHDSWDQWPEIGIRDSWARFLGLGQRIHASESSTSHAFHAIYEIAPMRLRDFAAGIAARVAPLGEDSVQVMGDPDRLISKPSLGVGCIGPDSEIVAQGSDAVIVCYDGAPYWRVRERLWEQGAAVICVEHGTTELPGIENLCHHLGEVFPKVPFQYFDDHPRTWTVRGAQITQPA